MLIQTALGLYIFLFKKSGNAFGIPLTLSRGN